MFDRVYKITSSILTKWETSSSTGPRSMSISMSISVWVGARLELGASMSWDLIVSG